VGIKTAMIVEKTHRVFGEIMDVNIKRVEIITVRIVPLYLHVFGGIINVTKNSVVIIIVKKRVRRVRKRINVFG
jgi:hypothetical protein